MLDRRIRIIMVDPMKIANININADKTVDIWQGVQTKHKYSRISHEPQDSQHSATYKNPAVLRHKNIKLNNGCMWLPVLSSTGSVVTLYQSHPSAKVLVTTHSFGKPKWKRLLAVMKHGCIIWAGESESVLLLTGFCDFHSFHRTILKCNSKEGKIINSEE